MRVTIFGSGYVGLVTGACLADAGNHVMCVDVDAARIERLKRGEVPIHEPGLEALIKRNAEAGRIEFTKPDRVVVGADNPRTTELMRALYEPFIRNHDRLIVMDVRSSELTKYAANAMLATKISFMNELAAIAERVGADIEKVRIGIGSDPRIGYHFIYPGCGYGGSCFPKDVQALVHTAADAGHRAELR